MGYRRSKDEDGTYDFAWAKVRPSPSGGISGAAVETPSANPICELRGRIVRVDDSHGWLTRQGVLTAVIIVRGGRVWHLGVGHWSKRVG